jgi:type I restriction enzyme S subunit
MKTKTDGTTRPLPPGWQWKKLGIVSQIINGSTPSTNAPEYWDGDILWATPTDIGKLSTIEIFDTERKITKAGLDSCSATMLPAGAVLLTSRAPVGNLAIAGNPLCTNQGFKSFVPNGGVDNRYLFFVLQHYVPAFQKVSHGNTFTEITKEMLQDFYLPMPLDLKEQRKIADHIEAQVAEAQRLSQAAKKQVEALHSLISALHREIFTSSEAKNWSIQPLSELIKSGPSNGIFKSPEYFGKGNRLVNVSDLYLGLEVNQVRLGRVDANADEQERYLVCEGDVFFCRSSLKFEGVGKCCYIAKTEEPTLFECHVIRVRPDTEKIRPDYLAFYFQAGDARKYILRAAKLGTMTTINHDDVRGFPVPIPSLEVQKTVVEMVIQKSEQILALQAKAEQQLEAINALRHAILQEAFGGFVAPVED